MNRLVIYAEQNKKTKKFADCSDSVISTGIKDKVTNQYNWFKKLIKYAILEAGGTISNQTVDFGFVNFYKYTEF